MSSRNQAASPEKAARGAFEVLGEGAFPPPSFSIRAARGAPDLVLDRPHPPAPAGASDRRRIKAAPSCSGRPFREQQSRQFEILFGRRLGQNRILQHAFLIEFADLFGQRRSAPGGAHACLRQKPLDALAPRIWNPAGALTPLRLARPVRPLSMLQGLGIVGKLGMNDQPEIGQVDAARRDIGRDADARASVAHGLHGLIALVLTQFARQQHGGEAAFEQCRVQVPDGFARVAKYDRALRLDEAQQIDDRMFGLMRSEP